MIILGIDPGLATTGVGVVSQQGNKLGLIHYGTVLTPAKMPLADRLLQLSRDLAILIKEYKPDDVAVEELFFSNNAKTAMVVSQARGVALVTAAQHDCRIHHYTPVQVKLGVCGHGKADKQQVQYMVKKLLSLSTIPKPDDAADALAIAICHSHSHRLKSFL